MRECSASLAIALCAVATGCGEKPAAAPAARPRPNLLVITLDTLRPDALGFVSGAHSTPAIDGLAREGFAFPSAVSPVPLTFPSHAALMTGRLPRTLGLRDNGQVLSAEPRTLAQRLSAEGYTTAAFVSGYPLHSVFGLDRGFARYDDALDSAKGEEPERKAPATVAAARAWLATAPPPWFVWVHLYDPHFPYVPPPPFRQAGARGAYDGEVAYADAAIGELRAAARTAGETLTVFAGDHGESLGEHGEGTHGFFVYDSTVLVPLIFHLPGRVPVGSSASGARLIDVTPTVLELLGIAPDGTLDGRSIAPLFTNARGAAEAAYVETYQPWLSYGWSPLRAMRSEGWKLIDAPRPELYDLRADPKETRDRFAEAPDQARRLKALLRAVESAPARPAQPAADAEALARLRSLGYLGGSAPGAEPPAQGLRDPKDGGAVRELLTEGDVAVEPRGTARRGDPLRGRAGAGSEEPLRAAPIRPRFAGAESGSAGGRSFGRGRAPGPRSSRDALGAGRRPGARGPARGRRPAMAGGHPPSAAAGRGLGEPGIRPGPERQEPGSGRGARRMPWSSPRAIRTCSRVCPLRSTAPAMPRVRYVTLRRRRSCEARASSTTREPWASC